MFDRLRLAGIGELALPGSGTVWQKGTRTMFPHCGDRPLDDSFIKTHPSNTVTQRVKTFDLFVG
jgi:hypothetical protein